LRPLGNISKNAKAEPSASGSKARPRWEDFVARRTKTAEGKIPLAEKARALADVRSAAAKLPR